ncbi:MAG TPA: substrate-binding domain-containing protein, partial [Candidatus Limnocylindrales bacterium]
ACASLAACATSSPPPSQTPAPSPKATRPAGAAGCIVGASWGNINDGEIGEYDDPALQKAVVGAGGTYISKNANSYEDQQAHDIDALVAAGARVIVVQPGADQAYLAALQRAIKAGVVVIAVLERVDVPSLYVAFDPGELGRQEAKALLAAKPRGNYAIITGRPDNPELSALISGIKETLQSAIDRGDVKLATIELPWMDFGQFSQKLQTLLSENGGSLDAVAAVEETIPYSIRGAIEDAGLAGKVAVAGVGEGSGLIGVNQGWQAVEVWANPERRAAAVARAAVALCKDPDMAKVEGSVSVTWPGLGPMRAVLVAPVTITRDNIDVAITTSMYWRQLICGDSAHMVPLPPACQLGPVASPSGSGQP